MENNMLILEKEATDSGFGLKTINSLENIILNTKLERKLTTWK